MLRNVYITVTNQTVPQVYYADSYPATDRNYDGKDDRYEVPVYKVFIEGTDNNGALQKKEWKALRFMPYWNDPHFPARGFKTKGYVVSGLNVFPKQAIKNYVSGYRIHNIFSDYTGAIQLTGNFLIHAGPSDLNETQWGGAGCIEVIGNFNTFRKDIMHLAGTGLHDIQDAMIEIIRQRKLFVEIENCATPVIKTAGNFTINK